MKRLLSLWLRDWPIQRLRSGLGENEARSHTPEPLESRSERAVILWQTDPRRGRLVVACCPSARRLGVRPGIAIAAATELVLGKQSASQPKPLVMQHDRIADSIALEHVASTLQHKISPLVAVESLDKRPWAGQILHQPDTLLCDLTGVTHLFGDETGVLSAVHGLLEELGLVGKLAIANNAAAAWAHAHENPRNDVRSDRCAEDLVPLSILGLRLSTETELTLRRLGVESIGSLLRLPRDGLAKRLGKGVVDRIAEVLGEVEVPLSVFRDHPPCEATAVLEYPTDDFEILADRLDRLAQEIVASLATSQRGALRLACRLDLTGHSRLEKVIGLFAPTLEAKHISCLLQSAFESCKLPSTVTRLTLTTLQSGTLNTSQKCFFEGDDASSLDEAGGRPLARLVDELSGRLGRDAVMGVRLNNNPLPEKSYRTYSLTDHRTRQALKRLPTRKWRDNARSGEETTATTNAAATNVGATNEPGQFRVPTRQDARRRPISLLRRPVPLVATDDAPAGALPSFRYEGRLHAAVHCTGPERIETAWWDGPLVRRDYFRIQTDTGHQWWIFCDLRTGAWFLHGRFS
ncbi:MAG: hypothetical protein AAFX06_03545 [Planctomycetota bacterium]